MTIRNRFSSRCLVVLISMFAFVLIISLSPLPEAEAGNPNYLLKEIREISWAIIIENNDSDKRPECNIVGNPIDSYAQAIVNQSKDLKFITHLERIRHQHLPKWDQHSKILRKNRGTSGNNLDYWTMPALWIDLETFGVNGICIGLINSKAEVQLDPSKIIGTDTKILLPKHVVWEDDIIIRSPPTAFERYARQTVGDRINKFINDWERSQRLQ